MSEDYVSQCCDKASEFIFRGELDKAIVAVISDEFGELCSVGLNKQYADLYLVDGGNDND